MARGKHKAAKEVRDMDELAKAIKAAQAELAAEQQRLQQTKRRADNDRALRAELATAVAARDRACAATLERMQNDRHALAAATAALTPGVDEAKRCWTTLADWGVAEFGMEGFIGVLDGDLGIVVSDGIAANRRLDLDAVQTIQRARGLRTSVHPNVSRPQRIAMATLVAELMHVPLPDAYDPTDDGWRAYMATVRENRATEIGITHPEAWINADPQPEHPISIALGAGEISSPEKVNEGAAQSIPTIPELSAGTAAQRNTVVSAGSAKVAAAYSVPLQRGLDAVANSQIPGPLAGPALYPAPADAAALASLYTTAAFGLWGRERTRTTGVIAVGAAAAIPFWLPPGHTSAYLDSEPLSPEDIDDVRLPFPQVLMTFAEPLRIPAQDPGPEEREKDARLRWIDNLVGSGRDIEPSNMRLAGSNEYKAPLPTLWEVVKRRGALVEGILLLADAHGNLDDQFAWCITIPSHAAGGVLGRWTIPARRSATRYGEYIANVAAVVAWADWHRPGTKMVDPADGADTNEVKTPAGTSGDAVHVLNVKATTPEPSNSSTSAGSGRSVTPHRRRGHWRRQHYGPGRQEVRRVRIAPVLVNAGRLGAERPQIYRLPKPV